MKNDVLTHALNCVQELWPDMDDKYTTLQVEALRDGIRRMDLNAEQATRALQQLYRDHEYRAVPSAKKIINALRNAENKPRQHRIPDVREERPPPPVLDKVREGREMLGNPQAHEIDALKEFYSQREWYVLHVAKCGEYRWRVLCMAMREHLQSGMVPSDVRAYVAELFNIEPDSESMDTAWQHLVREGVVRDRAQGGAA